jgi:hypothetical protein
MLRVLMVLDDYAEMMFLQTVLKKLGLDVDAIQNPRSFSDSMLRMNPDVLVMTALGKRVRGVDLARGVRRNRGLPNIILLGRDGTSHHDLQEVEGWLDSPVAALDLVDLIARLRGLDVKLLHDKFLRLQVQGIEKEKDRVRRMQDQGAVPASNPSSSRFPLTEPAGEGQVGDSSAPSAFPLASDVPSPKSAQSAPITEPTGTLQPQAQSSNLTPLTSHHTRPSTASGTRATNGSGLLAASTMPLEQRRERYKKFLNVPPPEEHGYSLKEVQAKVRDLRKQENAQDIEDIERERKAFVEFLFAKKAGGS